MRLLVTKSKDVLSEWLDFLKGSEVNDNSIFSELPAKYEREFFEDMKSLNVSFYLFIFCFINNVMT